MEGRGPRVCALLAAITAAGTVAHAEKMTLEEAVRRARRDNPDVRVAAAELRAAEGASVGAATIRNHPLLDLGIGPRFGAGGPPDGQASLSQTFELGGKRSKRTRAAELRATPGPGWSRPTS